MTESRRGQLSLRPSLRTLERLRAHARIVGQKHTVLAERYVAEGVLMDEHPGIHFRDGAMGRRPAVVGGMDVWEYVAVLMANDGSVAETAACLEVPTHLVETAARFYGSNRAEIDDWIARNDEYNERAEAQWRAAQTALSR